MFFSRLFQSAHAKQKLFQQSRSMRIAKKNKQQSSQSNYQLEALEPRLLLSAEVGLVPAAELLDETVLIDESVISIEIDAQFSDDAANNKGNGGNGADENNASSDADKAEPVVGGSEQSDADSNANDVALEEAVPAEPGSVSEVVALSAQETYIYNQISGQRLVIVDASVADSHALLEELLGDDAADFIQAQRDLEASKSPAAGAAINSPAEENNNPQLSLLDNDFKNPIAEPLTVWSDSERGLTVVVLDAERDGVQQISDLLEDYQGLSAVHVLSHGAVGLIRLGNTTLNNNKLDEMREQMSRWGKALKPGGDLLLYGCNVAEGEAGVEFIERLSAVTGVDVAASNDSTGSAELGGDWVLEESVGVIETVPLFSADFEGLLALKLIEGSESANTLTLKSAQVSGGSSPSSISFSAADDLQVDGKGGNDTFVFNDIPNAASVSVDGGFGTQDKLDFSTSNQDLFFTVTGKTGDVTVKDASGNVLITASNIEFITGGAGNDTFFFDGKSVLKGDVVGGDGNDSFIFAAGAQLEGKLDGDGGSSTDAETNTLAYSYKLIGGKPDISDPDAAKKGYGIAKVDFENGKATAINSALPNGIKNIEKVIGGLKKDTLTGGADADLLLGGKGGDVLDGAAGNDTLTGGSGKDFIVGGLGNDQLIGGKGSDLYIFDNDWGDDTVVESPDSSSIPFVTIADTLDFTRVDRDIEFELTKFGIIVSSDSVVPVSDGRQIHDDGGPLYVNNITPPTLTTDSGALEFALRIGGKYFTVNIDSYDYQLIDNIADEAPASDPTIESVVDASYVAGKLAFMHKQGQTLTIWPDGAGGDSDTGALVFLRDQVSPTAATPAPQLSFQLRAGTLNLPVDVTVAGGATSKAEWLGEIETAVTNALNGVIPVGVAVVQSSVDAGYINGNLNFSHPDGERLTIWPDVSVATNESGQIVFLRDEALPQSGVLSNELNFNLRVSSSGLAFTVNVVANIYTGTSAEIKAAWLADIEQAIGVAMTGANDVNVTQVDIQEVDIEQEILEQWVQDVEAEIRNAAKAAGLSAAAADAINVGLHEGQLAISDSNNGRIILWTGLPLPASDPGDDTTVTKTDRVTSVSATADRSSEVEVIKAGKANNVWIIQDGWTGDILLENPLAANELPTAVLDLSALTVQMSVIDVVIDKNSASPQGNKVTVELFDGSELVFTNIATIKGGQYFNTFTFKEGGRLAGNLDGSAGTDNTIIYKGSEIFTADLSDMKVDFIAGKATNIHYLVGGKLGDRLNGDDSDNTLSGKKGRDILEGRAGADTLYGGGGNDALIGGDGADQLHGGSNDDFIVGGQDDDVLFGDGGADRLLGGDGNDTLDGGSGKDILIGGAGDDTLKGGRGSDSYLFSGDWGNDTVNESGFFTGSEDVLDFSAVTVDLAYSLNKGGLTAGTGAFKYKATNEVLQLSDLSNNDKKPPYAPKFTAKASGDVEIEFSDANKNTVTATDRSKLDKLLTGQGQNIFLFGDDWGGEFVIDNSQASAALFLDFRAVTKELRFTFSTDNKGVTKLEVERVQRLLNDWMKQLPYGGVVDAVASRGVDKITIINIDANTEIRGGGNINSFIPEKGAKFAGEVHGTNGLRPSTFSNFLLGEPKFVVNTIDYSNAIDVDKVNLSNSKATDLDQAFDMNGVKLGAGLNYVVGTSAFIDSNGEHPDNKQPGLLEKFSLTELGIDKFESAIGLPSISMMAGKTGGDTYKLNSLWGFAGIVEIPDVVIGGEAIPEFFDTLDFSGVVSEMEITVYDFSDNLRDWFNSLLPQNNDTDPNNNIILPGFGANIIVASEIGVTDILNDLVGSNFLPGGLPTSTVVAIDIENIITSDAKTTVKFVDGASIRGTLTGKDITLDYSEYLPADPADRTAHDTFIEVDLTASGIDFKLPSIDSPIGTLGGGSLTYGMAPGVEGHRFGGLTTLVSGTLDFLDAVGVQGVDSSSFTDKLADFGVKGVTGIIGTDGNDMITGNVRDMIIAGNGGSDTINAERGNNTLSYDGISDPIIVDLGAKTGTNINSLNNFQNVLLGQGNDDVTGSSGNNIFYFTDDWGFDVIQGEGGQDVLDFSRLSDPSQLLWDTAQSGAGQVVLYTEDSNGVRTNEVIAYGDNIKVMVPDDSFLGRIGKKTVVLESNTALAAAQLPSSIITTALTTSELDAVITEAKDRLRSAGFVDAQNVAATNAVDLDDLVFEITDLNELGLALSYSDYSDANNPVPTVLLDGTAAGNGWFTEVDDALFTVDASDARILNANAASAAEGRQDLLTTVMHEMGHAIGLGHDQKVSLSLMDDALSASQRLLPPDFADLSSLSPTDQTLLEEGLADFAGWISGLGTRIENMFDSNIKLPFVDISYAQLFGFNANASQQIFDSISTQILAQVTSVFANSSGTVSSADLLLNNGTTEITATPSSNLKEFSVVINIASIDLTSGNNAFALDFANSGFGDEFAALGIELDGSFTLDINAGSNLEFIFGIDENGEFYVDNPGLTAFIDAGHDVAGDLVPVNVGIAIGPLGLEITNGSIDIGTSMRLGSDGRISQSDMRENRVKTQDFNASLGSDSHIEAVLPVSLSSSLPGLEGGAGTVIRVLNQIVPDSASIQAFLSGVDLTVENIDDLLNFNGLSLSDIINGLIAAIDEMTGKDSDGDGTPDGLLYETMPGINKRLVDVLGDGSSNILDQIRNILIEVRDTNSSDIQALQNTLNTEFNNLFGDGTDPFALRFDDSLISFDFSLETAFAGNEAFSVDLKDYLPGELSSFGDFIELNASGQVDVAAYLDIDLGLGVDLSANILDGLPIFIDDSSSFDAGLKIETLQPIDALASIDLSSVGLGTIGLSIVDGLIDVDMTASFGLLPDGDDGRYRVGELGGSVFDYEILGNALVDLPIYFPNPDLPLGGTTQDVNGDGYADNVLRIDAEFSEAGASDINIIAPDFAGMFDLGALLNDPATILLGLEGMFDGFKLSLENEFFDLLDLPLIGSALKDINGAAFIDDLRDKLLGNKVGANYQDGLGYELQNANGRSTLDLIRIALYNALGDVLEVPVMATDPITGLLVPTYDFNGKVITQTLTGPDDIQLVIDGNNLQFNIIIAGEVFPTKTIGLDFSTTVPGFELNSDAGLEISLDYVFGLGLGIGAAGFYVDTSGISESGSEFAMDLDVLLTGGIEGQLGFLEASLRDYDGNDADGNPFASGDLDGPSGLNGSFDIDLADGNNDGRWVIVGPGSAGDNPSLNARLSASANMDLYASLGLPDVDLSALGIADTVLAMPSIFTVIHYDQLFAELEIGSNGFEFNGLALPELWFEEVTVDAGEFISKFVGPIIQPILTIIEPIKPFVALLTKEIGFLAELGAPFSSLRDMIALVKGEKAVAAIDAIQALVTMTDELAEFADAGLLSFGDFFIELGGSELTPTQNEVDSSPGQNPSQGSGSGGGSATDKNKQAKDKINQVKNKGDFELTLLTDPFNAVNLLLGKTADIFKYDLPPMDVTLDFGKSIPVFPGLNARFGGEITALIDLAFGFDTRGFLAFQEEQFDPAFSYLLFNGFYIDDQIEGGIDSPEVTLIAQISAGASIGIGGLVEAGIEGGVRGTLNFDLNDFPRNDGGKFYADEILKRLNQGVECLFDIDGSLNAFLDAFFWVGLDLGLTEITLYEYRQSFINEVLADFTFSCPPPVSPDVAVLDSSGGLSLRYSGANVGDAQTYKVEYEDTLNLTKLYDYAVDLAASGDVGKDALGNDILIKDKNGRSLVDSNGDPLANQIIVKSRGVVEVFDASSITSITSIGSNENDRYLIGDDVFANSAIESVTISTLGGDDNVDLGGAKGTNAGGLLTVNIDGGAGDDILKGSSIDDVISGGSGNDKIFGFDGDDVLYAVTSSSAANSESGKTRNADRIVGGSGSDIIRSGDGDDQLFGDFEEELPANRFISGDDEIYGGSGVDFIVGSYGDDQLFGDAGNDNLLGGDGADSLSGGADDDLLEGGADDDVLVGEAGRDYLIGGLGIDSVDGGSGADTIEWVDGDGDDSLVSGGSNAAGTVDKFILKSEGIRNDVIDINAAGLDADVIFNLQLFSLENIEFIDLDAYLGADTIRIEDLSGTSIEGVTIAFGQGEILETVPVTQLVGKDLRTEQPLVTVTPMIDPSGQQRIFNPTDLFLDADEVILESFYQLSSGGTLIFDADGAPVLVTVDVGTGAEAVAVQVQDIVGGLPTVNTLNELTAVETRANGQVREIFLATDVLDTALETDQSFYQFAQTGLSYRFDAIGEPVLRTVNINGDDYLVQELSNDPQPAITDLNELVAVETRIVVGVNPTEVEIKRVFDSTVALAENQSALQNFYRIDVSQFLNLEAFDLDYLFDDSGDPVLVNVDIAGMLYSVQDIEGGLPAISDLSELKAVETRQIERSNMEVGPVYDPDTGEEIPGETDLFVKQIFGLDTSPDNLYLFGSDNADDFVLNTVTDELRGGSWIEIDQLGGVAFTVLNSNNANDQITIDTSDGADNIDASGLGINLLKQLNIDSGGGDDRVIGSPFIDVLDTGLGNDRVTGGSGVDIFIDEGGSDTLIEQRNEFGFRDQSLFGNYYIVGDLFDVANGVYDNYADGAEVENMLFNGAAMFEFAELSGGDTTNTLVINDDDGQVTVGGSTLSVDRWSTKVILDNVTDEQSSTPEQYVVFMDGSGGMDVTISDTGGKLGRDELIINGSSLTEYFILEVINPGLVDEDPRVRAVKGGNEDVVHYLVDLVNNNRINALIINSLGGDDQFLLNDNRVDTLIYAGSGRDNIIVGSVGTKLVNGIPVVDSDLLTPGVTARTSIYGGSGNDTFEINHNQADLWLYGGTGDDVFVLNTFLVEKNADLTEQKILGVVGGEGNNTYDMQLDEDQNLADLFDYLQNGNVFIDGGPGKDTIVVNGTAIGDLFVVTENFIAGAGRYITFENIERIEVNGAGGDDQIYVLSTAENMETVIRGGSGNDEIIMGGDAPGVYFDPPEFLFSPDAVLVQDLRLIYPVHVVAARLDQARTFYNWVGVTRDRIEDNTAYYRYNSYPSWYSVRNNNLKPYENYLANIFERPQDNIFNFFNKKITVEEERRIQLIDSVPAYLGYSFSLPGEAGQQAMLKYISIDSINSSFRKWDGHKWNAHHSAQIASYVEYSVPSYNYIDFSQGWYATPDSITPDAQYLDPNSYWVDEGRVDDLSAFKGQLFIDGGNTVDIQGNANEDSFIVHNENGTVTDGTLGKVYSVQQQNATGQLLYQSGSVGANDVLGGWDVDLSGAIQEGDSWTLNLDGKQFTVISATNDQNDDVLGALLSKLLSDANYTGSLRVDQSEWVMNVQRVDGSELSDVSFVTTNAENDRREFTVKVFGADNLGANDVVVDTRVVLNGFGQFEDAAIGAFGVEVENIDSMQLRLSSAADDLTIEDSIEGTTEVALSGGDDNVLILGTTGEVTILGGAGDDLVTVGNATHSVDGVQGKVIFKGDADRWEESVATGNLINLAQINADGEIIKKTIDFTQANLNANFQNAPTISDSDYSFNNAAVFNNAAGYEELDDNGDIKEVNGRVVYVDGQTEAQHGQQYAADGSLLTPIVKSFSSGDYLVKNTAVKVFETKPDVQNFQVRLEVNDLLMNQVESEIIVYYDEVVSSGAGSNDRLVINNVSSSNDENGSLSADAVTGLGMAEGVRYSGIEEVDVLLGDGSDTFNVLSTSVLSKVDAGGADDAINVSSDAPANLGDLAGINGELFIDAGAGQNMLNVSDAADVSGDVAALLTDQQIIGLSAATINYKATGGDYRGGINVWLGQGDDALRVDSLLVQAPTFIYSGSGNDVVTVGSLAGNQVDQIRSLLTVEGQAGSDSLIINDAGDGKANTGTVDSDRISGLGMAVGMGVVYQGIDSLEVLLGAGADELTVVATHENSTRVNVGAGEDEVNVISVDGVTVIEGGADSDRINVGSFGIASSTINAALTLDGEAAGDIYNLTLAGDGAALINVWDTGSGLGDLLNIDGTNAVDQFLLRREFIALINDDEVERVNYNSDIELLTIDSLAGGDRFNLDDNSAETVINSGEDNDTIQIGQMFNDLRDVSNVAAGDVFDTLATTKGYLSYGVSYETTINGGDGGDQFLVLHNEAVLNLNGEDGNDSFIVRAFALASTGKAAQSQTNVVGGGDEDYIEYAINAPVNIDGGSGNDRVSVLGTEFADTFVITNEGVYGAGLNVSYKNTEILEVNSMEGDDNIHVLSTNANMVTRVFGGLGSDNIYVGGNAPDDVVAVDENGNTVIFPLLIEQLDRISGPLYVLGGVDILLDSSIANPVMLPDETDLETFILADNPNLRVNEEDQEDVLTVLDAGDTVDNKGVLTHERLTGLGMGDDLTVNGEIFNGGISYLDFEIVNLQLGSGNDELLIESTHQGETNIRLGGGNDELNLRSTSGLLNVEGEGGDDVFNIGSDAPVMGAGLINNLDANVALSGDDGSDALNIDDGGENRDTRFDITGSTIDSEYMAGTINYGLMAFVNVDTGSGNDLINIQGTQLDAQTAVATAAGNDVINISNPSETLDDVQGDLAIEAGAGLNTLNVSDYDSLTGDLSVSISRNEISGLAPSLIQYTAQGGRFAGGVNIWASRAADDIHVGSVRDGDVTTLWTNSGDDRINVIDDGSGDDGLLIVFAEAGNDVVDVAAWQTETIIFGDYGSVEFASHDIDNYKADIGTRKDRATINYVTSLQPDVGGDDTLIGSSTTDYLIGGFADDRLFGNDGRDYLLGDNGEFFFLQTGEQVTLLNSQNVMTGDGDVSSLGVMRSTNFALGGSDELEGGNGDDILIGGAEGDRLIGGLGNDMLIGDAGQLAQSLGRPVSVETILDDDLSIGGNDLLAGDFAALTIDPLGGNDVMFGGFGADVFYGNLAQDVIIGEYGRMILSEGQADFLVRLGQGSLDVAASTMFTLYGSNPSVPVPFKIQGVPPTASELADVLLKNRQDSVDSVQEETLDTTHHEEGFSINSLPGTRSINAGYTVEKGNSLWNIAEEMLGDPTLWPEIWKLNPEIENPDLIVPGQVIKLPTRQGNDADLSLHDGENTSMDDISEEELMVAAAGLVGLQSRRTFGKPHKNSAGGAYQFDQASQCLRPSFRSVVNQQDVSPTNANIDWDKTFSSRD